MPDRKEFVNGLKDEAGTLAKSELIGLVTSTKTDADAFVRKQAEKLERYLNQLVTSGSDCNSGRDSG